MAGLITARGKSGTPSRQHSGFASPAAIRYLHRMADQPHDLYEAEHADRKNARLGMSLFVVYFIVYAAFVAICAFSLKTMQTPVLGVNLAVFYGFALIGFAFMLALIYMWACGPSGDSKNGGGNVG